MTTDSVSTDVDNTGATDNKTIEINFNDIQAMKAIITVVSQRGGFKPEEMVSVGHLYAKLDAFIKAVEASQQSTESKGAKNNG